MGVDILHQYTDFCRTELICDKSQQPSQPSIVAPPHHHTVKITLSARHKSVVRNETCFAGSGFQSRSTQRCQISTPVSRTGLRGGDELFTNRAVLTTIVTRTHHINDASFFFFNIELYRKCPRIGQKEG